jgi:hypothetical protein
MFSHVSRVSFIDGIFMAHKERDYMSRAVQIKKTGSMHAWMSILMSTVIFILLMPAVIFSATRTVCAACGYTSIANAYAVANTGDTIDIQENRVESLTWAKAVNITSTLQNITWNGAAGTAATLTTNGNIGNTAWTISNITMDHSDAAGGYTIYLYNAPAPNLTITNCTLMRTSTSTTNNAVINADGTWNANTVTLSRCLVIGNNYEYGLAMSGGNRSPSYALVNTIMYGFGSAAYAAVVDGSTNVRQSVQMTNCTIYGNACGYRYTGASGNAGTTVQNTVFANNTTDAAPHTNTDYTYCAFEQGTGFGTGCQYTVVDATEFVNAAAYDFHLASTSVKCRNKGTNAGAPAVDFDGTARPQEGTVDIGAYEYLPPTPTATPTASPSVTRTGTSTGTATRTQTSTASPSVTRTGTPTGTVTVSPTSTRTATPTFSQSPTPSITSTPQPTLVCDAEGNTHIGNFSSNGLYTGNIYGARYYLNTGAIQQIIVYVASNAAGNIAAAVYADNAGVPAARLALSGNQAMVNLWNTIPFSYNITTAGYYWLAFQFSADGPYFNADTLYVPANCENTIATGAFPTWPGTWGGTGTYNTSYISMYAQVCNLATYTVTPTATPSISATVTQTATPSSSPTDSATPTGTSTITVTLTQTATVSPSVTPSTTPTGTDSITETFTRLPTQNLTASQSVTPTLTVTETATVTQTPTEISTSTPDAYAYIAPAQAVSGQETVFTYHVNAMGDGPITSADIQIPAGAVVTGAPASLMAGAVVALSAGDILVTYPAGWNIWSDPNFDTITFNCVSAPGSMCFGSYLNGLPGAAGLTPNGYSQCVNFVTPTVTMTQTPSFTPTITPTPPGTFTNTPTYTQTPPFTPTQTSTITLTLTPGASGITVVLSDLAPAVASNGEKGIKLFDLDLANAGLNPAGITAFTVTTTDGAGSVINAAAILGSVTAVDNEGNTYTAVFAGNKITFTAPVNLPGLGTDSLHFYADIKAGASPGIIRIGVQSAADISASVAVTGSFPEMTAGTALKTTPVGVDVSFYDLMPPSVSVGQADVYVMVFTVSNTGTVDNSPVAVTALTLTAMDEMSNMISANSDIARLVIRDNDTVYFDTTAIPAGGNIYCPLSQPIPVSAAASANFYCVIDITGTARTSADYLKLGLIAAQNISVSDIYSGAAVTASAKSNYSFPMVSGAALIQNRAQELHVVHADKMPGFVSTDQDGVEAMTLVLTDVGDALTAPIMVSRLYVHVQDSNGLELSASTVLKSLEITDSGGASVKGTATGLGASKVMINLTAPVIVPADSSVTISVRADIAPVRNSGNHIFRLSIESPDEIYAVDSNVFSKVNITSTVDFPKNSGYADIQDKATDVTLNNFSPLLPAAPLGVLKGQSGVRLFSFQISDTTLSPSSANALFYGVTMTTYSGGAVQAANNIFKNVFITDASGNTVGSIAPLTGGTMAVNFLTPIVLASASPAKTLTVYADILPNVLFPDVRVDVDSASDISVKDANSLLEVNKTISPPLPWQAGPADIYTAPATDLKVSHDGSTVPTLVGMGQTDVKFMALSFYNNGYAGVADIQVTGITLTVMNQNSVTVSAGSVLETVYVENQKGDVIFGKADVTSDSVPGPFYISLDQNALDAPASATTTVYISADIPLNAAQGSVKLRLAGDGVDSNSMGLYVTCSAMNSILDPFPMDSALTTITALAFDFKVKHKDLMPVSVSGGQAGIQAMQLQFSSANTVPIKVTGLALAVKDGGGALSPANNYLSSMIIVDETGTTIGSAAAGPSGYVYVTLTPLQVTSSSDRSITLLINIKNGAQGSFYLELENDTDVNTLPLSSVNPMLGDAFGMRTKAVSIKGTDLAGTFHFFPNPFYPGSPDHGQCHVEYYLADASKVTVKIYTMDGRLVRILADRVVKGTGLHYEDTWDGQNGSHEKVNSGIYLCVLKAANSATGVETKLTQKIMVVR